MKKGFFRFFCVCVGCIAVIAIWGFALLGAGVIKNSSGEPNNQTGIIETNGEDKSDKDGATGDTPSTSNPEKPKKDFDFKFVEIDGEIYISEIGDFAIDDEGKVELPSKTTGGRDVVGIIDGAGNHEGIKEIIIPEGIKDIKDNAFAEANNVTKIVIESKDVYDALDDDLFGIGKDNKQNVEIVVNKKVDDSSNSMLEDDDFYILENVISRDAEGNILKDADDNQISYNHYTYNATDFKIRNGYVLGFKSSVQQNSIKEITLGTESLGVAVIGVAEGAFKNNKNLTSITLEESVIMVGKGAFYGCSNVKTMLVANGIAWAREENFHYSGYAEIIKIEEGKDYYLNGVKVTPEENRIYTSLQAGKLYAYALDPEEVYNACVNNNELVVKQDISRNGDTIIIPDCNWYLHNEEFIALSKSNVLEVFINDDKYDYACLDGFILIDEENGTRELKNVMIVDFFALFFKCKQVIITVTDDITAIDVDAITDSLITDLIFEDTTTTWTGVKADGTDIEIKFTADAKNNLEVLKTLKAGTKLVKNVK